MTNIQQSILCLIRQIEQDYKIYAFIEFIDGNMSVEFSIPSDYSAAGIYACKVNSDAYQSYVKQRHIFSNLQRIIEGVPANTKLDQYTLKK